MEQLGRSTFFKPLVGFAGLACSSNPLNSLVSGKETERRTPFADVVPVHGAVFPSVKYIEDLYGSNGFSLAGRISGFSSSLARAGRRSLHSGSSGGSGGGSSKFVGIEFFTGPVLPAIQANPKYQETKQIITGLIGAVSRGTHTRDQLKTIVLERCYRMGVNLSDDTDLAIDAIIDLSLTAVRYDLISESAAPDTFTIDHLSELFTLLFIHNDYAGMPEDSKSLVRISDVELRHVPIVVEANLGLFKHASDITNSGRDLNRLKRIFVQSLLHDGGKFDLGIRTQHGYKILPNTMSNQSNEVFEVLPGETLQEALNERSKNDREFDRSKIKAAPSLVGVLTHHDSASVYRLTHELAEAGIISKPDQFRIWESIRCHGFVSSWIQTHSNKGIGIRSNLFDDHQYAEFNQTYLDVVENLKLDSDLLNIIMTPDDIFIIVDEDPEEIQKKVSQLERLYVRSFPDPETRSMLMADHVGQLDIAKYLKILHMTNAGPRPDMTIHQILFGHEGLSTSESLEFTIAGVFKTHFVEIHTLEPDTAILASPVFQNANKWLFNEDVGKLGLAQSVFKDSVLRKAFQAWRRENQGTLHDWLMTVPIYELDDQGKVVRDGFTPRASQLFAQFLEVVRRDFYEFYKPTIMGNGYSLLSIESEPGITRWKS